ncbi:MAG: hypothetical protein ABEK84_03205 [Salinibacter sp.]
MSYFIPGEDEWTETGTRPDEPPFIEVDDDRPLIRFVGASESLYELSGAPARSGAETIHTLAIVSSDLTDGLPLCALRADGDDLTVEDRRPPEARTRYADAFEQLRSALDEILIPVYIDDAVEEVSETVEGLVAIHTAEYADPPQSSCSYFRTAVMQDGALLLETERGAL